MIKYLRFKINAIHVQFRETVPRGRPPLTQERSASKCYQHAANKRGDFRFHQPTTAYKRGVHHYNQSTKMRLFVVEFHQL